MSVAWPTVKDRLVALLPTLPGYTDVKVYDGPSTSAHSVARWVTVGYQPSTEDLSAGSYEQTQTGAGGFLSEERGTVGLEFSASVADAEIPDAFGLVDALHDSVQADQTLGVMTPGSTSSLSVSVVQAQSTKGAVQRLLVTFTYFTRVA